MEVKEGNKTIEAYLKGLGNKYMLIQYFSTQSRKYHVSTREREPIVARYINSFREERAKLNCQAYFIHGALNKYTLRDKQKSRRKRALSFLLCLVDCG